MHQIDNGLYVELYILDITFTQIRWNSSWYTNLDLNVMVALPFLDKNKQAWCYGFSMFQRSFLFYVQIKCFI